MGQIPHLFKKPLAWIYGATILMVSAHILFTRTNGEAIDFYNFWMVPQAIKDLKTIDIYEFENQPAIGTFYFNKYNGKAKYLTDRSNYSPFSSDPNFDIRKDYMSTNGQYFYFTDPMVEVPILERVSAFRRTFPDMTATPFLYAVVSLFETGNFERDYSMFRIYGLVSVILALIVFCNVLQFSAAHTFLISTSILFFFYPLRQDVSAGNVMNAQLGLVAIAIWFYSKHKPWSALVFGAFVAVSSLYKPSTLFILPCVTLYWALRKDWWSIGQSFLGTTVGACLAFLATRIFFGSFSPWLRWYELVFKKILNRDDYISEMTNYSPAQFFFQIFGGNMFLYGLLFTALSILLIVFALFRSSRGDDSPSEDTKNIFLIVALSCAAMMVSSKLVWQFYQVSYLPLLIYVLKTQVDRVTYRSGAWTGLFVLLLIFMIMSLDGHDWRYRQMSGMIQAGVNVLASFTLFGLGIMHLWARFVEEPK